MSSRLTGHQIAAFDLYRYMMYWLDQCSRVFSGTDRVTFGSLYSFLRVHGKASLAAQRVIHALWHPDYWVIAPVVMTLDAGRAESLHA